MIPEEVIKYLSGNSTKKDKEIVEKWLAENHPEAEKKLERLQYIWEKTEDLNLDKNVDRAWNTLTEKIQKQSESEVDTKVKSFPQKKLKHSFIHNAVRIAAALLVVAITYGFFQLTYTSNEDTSSSQEVVYNRIVSGTGEQVSYRFNDSSKVVLNANSSIRYRSDFGTGTRNLFLEGEAYFEVNHDHPLPFTVYAGNMRIKDIGTKFNINAYSEGDFYEVAVSEGEVEVATSESEINDSTGNKAASTSQPIRISQGQMVEVGRKVGQMVISKANLQSSLGWLNKHLIFEEETFAQVINRLERYYNINIEVLNDSLLEKEVTASFEDERMENVIKILSLSLEANYNINGDTVEFYSTLKTK